MRLGRTLLTAGVIAAGVGTMTACGSDSTGASASLSGSVRLLLETGANAPDQSGAVVELRGPSGTLTQTTDSIGAFSFTGLEKGTYQAEFRKEGYGTIEASTLNLGSLEAQARLPQLSSVEILHLVTDPRLCNAVPCLDITIRTLNAFPEGVTRRIFRAYYGLVNRTDITDYLASFIMIVPSDDPGISIAGDTTIISLRGISDQTLAALAPDVELEFFLYGATENYTISWVDRNTGLPIYVDLSEGFGRTEFVTP